MKTRTPEELAEGLYHFLSGYGRKRPENLNILIAYADWQTRAREEMERRIAEVLEAQDLETLAAIAEGKIDMVLIASRVRDGK